MSESFSYAYEDEVLELLVDVVDPSAHAAILLEGGHYNSARGPCEFSVSSLQAALHLGETLIGEFGKNLRLVFGILIDDLGSPGIGVTNTGVEQLLPEVLTDVISSHRLIKADRLGLRTERNARNRAVDRLKKLCRNGVDEKLILKEEADQTSVVLDCGFEADITLGYLKSSGPTAHCPAIMGQHYADCLLSLKKRFPLSEQLLVLDWSETFDFWKVTGGARACHELFLDARLKDTQCEIANVFFGDAAGEIYQLHHESPTSTY